MGYLFYLLRPTVLSLFKARVTCKTPSKEWSNAKGEGKLFSFNLLEEEGGEIRCTCFNAGVDQFEPLLQEGSIYTFTGGKLKASFR